MNASKQDPIIKLKDVCKSFGEFQALNNFNLEVSKGGLWYAGLQGPANRP
jgi:ABC-type uncharacterized transport system ATPase subunit